LLAAIPDKAKIIALDERGTSLTSVQLAKKIETWRDEGFADMAFLIGGADGHDPSIRDKADLILNLGTLTWPHMLVRVLIAEQLWRAHSILSGHPYHRE
jgi:23S rRNA (pseudouridine1915-N3)-methyltransferase